VDMEGGVEPWGGSGKVLRRWWQAEGGAPLRRINGGRRSGQRSNTVRLLLRETTKEGEERCGRSGGCLPRPWGSWSDSCQPRLAKRAGAQRVAGGQRPDDEERGACPPGRHVGHNG
jgi:hypothetical protein